MAEDATLEAEERLRGAALVLWVSMATDASMVSNRLSTLHV